MKKNKKVIITSVVALAVASCVILTSFALKSNSVSADNVGNELSINDESIEMIFEELEKIKTLIKSGDNTLGFGDTEEALYLYELALSGLAELELSYIEEPNSEIINEIEIIAKELAYKIEEVKNSLESEESSTEISTTSTNTTTSNTNTSTNTNTNSNISSANTSNSTSGSTNNNSSNSNISTPTETTTTSDSSNSNSNNSNTSSDNTNSSTESTTNSNNSSNSTSTPSNNTTNTSTSEDELSKLIDDFFKDAPLDVDGGGMQEAHFELTGEIVGH